LEKIAYFEGRKQIEVFKTADILLDVVRITTLGSGNRARSCWGLGTEPPALGVYYIFFSKITHLKDKVL